jgi:hypothetical protein
MKRSAAEAETPQNQLASEIDSALETCDRLGASQVGCYLQMARDLLAGEAWRAALTQPTTIVSPEADETASEQRPRRGMPGSDEAAG